MIWRRTSADSDGFLNGDQKFGFPQNRVPGVEANPTTILRSFHEPYLLLPLTTHLRLLYRLLSRPQATLTSHNGIYSALPRERMANTPSYVIPLITATRPSRIPGPSSHHITSGFLVSFSQPPLYSLSTFYTLYLHPHVAPLMPSHIIPPLLFAFPVRNIRYHATCTLYSPEACCTLPILQGAVSTSCWWLSLKPLYSRYRFAATCPRFYRQCAEFASFTS